METNVFQVKAAVLKKLQTQTNRNWLEKNFNIVKNTRTEIRILFLQRMAKSLALLVFTPDSTYNIYGYKGQPIIVAS